MTGKPRSADQVAAKLRSALPPATGSGVDADESAPVTVTVARTVAPGREQEFEDWSARLTSAATSFPGFLGAGLLKPASSSDPWHVIFRFANHRQLDRWETSGQRASILAEGSDLVHATDMHRVSGLETWFQLPGRTAPAPPKWKMFLTSGMVIFLLNLVCTFGYGWSLDSWPRPAHIALISFPVTAAATWLVMPRATRLLRAWLYPARRGAVPRRR